MQDLNAPIIVAVAQQTWKDRNAERTPADVLEHVAREALDDSGCQGLVNSIDTVAHVRFIADTNPQIAPLLPRNPAKEVSTRIGITDAHCIQGTIGGNTPQFLINRLAENLASGKSRSTLLFGAELLDTFFNALKTGADISAWAGDETESPFTLGKEREGLNDFEAAHQLYEPITTYPLFEVALQHHLGGSQAEHQQRIGALYSGMSRVAAANPHSWRAEALSADGIMSATERNRMISTPYVKALNPVLAVDMAAAIVLTTVGEAQRLGIEEAQWVYLRAGIDLNDIWHVSQRETLHNSPAIGACARAVFAQSGLSLADMSAFDLYSCFPSAVQIACNEIGLREDDPRGVTVTGGMPFFGGPGNNYALHGVAQMVLELRGKAHSHGIVTGNGLYLTKHSMGLYSTEAPKGTWQPIDSLPLQEEINNGEQAVLASEVEGDATIETFTVTYDHEGPAKGVVFARNAKGERVLATIQGNAEQLKLLLSEGAPGVKGRVSRAAELNRFEL